MTIDYDDEEEDNDDKFFMMMYLMTCKVLKSVSSLFIFGRHEKDSAITKIMISVALSKIEMLRNIAK